ncbi:MAG: acyl-CoA dehydrogenase family protein [Actinomycetota bacterium]|nr:acyl-CoA dehydrogenase family protein [Actinomycetota bacterium]
MPRPPTDPRPPIPTAYRSDDRVAIQEMARDFAMNRVLPVANELDPEHGLIPESLRKEMGELGFFGILIGTEYDGLGLGAFEYALITEELARAWMSVASIIARSSLARSVNRARRAEILPRAARGEWLGAFAMSEPDAGSDVASIRTRAERTDGGWLINGQKMWCTFADQANALIVVARTTPYDPARRHSGIRQFVVEKEPGTLPEGCTGNPIRKIGYHGWNTFELSFSDCFVPEDGLVGNEAEGAAEPEAQPEKASDGFARTVSGMTIPRIHTAARSIGLARGALEDSIRYVGERHQFDRPIADFQAIRFKIATMASEIEACRALMYQVADDADHGANVDDRAAMLKYLAAEMSERVTSEGLQIHGGAGYTTDFAIERYWRDARLTKIFEGTSEIMQRIVSDSLLGRSGLR